MIKLSFTYKSLLIIIALPFSMTCFSQTFTEQTVISVTGVTNISGAWGDYDNDGDLDVLLMAENTSTYFSKIYRNNGDNTFKEQTDIVIEEVTRGFAAWGDYDNDGYLDFVLTGEKKYGPAFSMIYHNEGGSKFTGQSNILLAQADFGSVAWGDYDNDGFLDLLQTGWSIDNVSKIYRNDRKNNFTEQPEISLTGVRNSAAAMGDDDNDGDLDILLSGNTNNGDISKIYRNNGDNSFTELMSLPAVQDGAVAWGDYDNDGYLDILLTGKNGYPYTSPFVSKIYHNEGNNTFTEQTGISLTGVFQSSAAWGDFDNDGDLDVLISGSTAPDGSAFILKIYRNNGDNTFTEQTNIASSKGKVTCADYDGDGDLDILLIGSGVVKVFTNNTIVKNQIPDAPTGIEQNVTGNDVILKWKPVTTDATLAKAISYNVKVGTTSGAINILSPQASDSGLRQIAAMGNGQLDTVFSLKNLNKGTYYWSVQAIDNCYKGGKFSDEGSFTITANKPAYGISVSSYEGSYAVVNWNRGTLEKCIVFLREGTGSFVPQNNTSYVASAIFGEGTDAGNGYYCVYNGIGDNVKVTGLKGRTNYTVQVFEYDGSAGQENYMTTDLPDNITSFTTLPFTYKGSWIGADNIELGDYDNDGYVDILMTDIQDGIYTHGITKIYRNNGDNTFTGQNQISLIGIYLGTAKWGDYNNDGYLDIIESGQVHESKSWIAGLDTTMIYKNNGDGTFTSQKDIKFPALDGSYVAWGDYDNDGYLDILLTGSGVSEIYRNNGDNTFTEQTGILLAGISFGSAEWGDYNNDGNLDIVLTGSGISKIYRNNGDNTFTEQTAIILSGVSNSSVAWGDYDNDGFADLLITGKDPNNLNISEIYRNNGDNTFTEQTGISLTGVYTGSARWGDYDNDGSLDILLAGCNGSCISKIYRNNGNNTFTELTGFSFPTSYGKCIAWGDLDNDKDLDIIVREKIYTNDLKVASPIPNIAPGELEHIVTLNSVKLTWKPVSQSLSGKGVSYNLNVFNKTKSINTIPSNSTENGFRKVVYIGNAQLNTSYILKDLKNGTYYWQVQSVDNNFQGGAFSAIDSFNVNNPFQSSGLSISKIDGASALLGWQRGNLDKCVVFIKEGSGNLELTNNTTYNASAIFKKGSVTADGWYCMYSGTGESVQVKGLNGLTDYTAIVIEFDGNLGSEQYLSTFSPENSVAFKTSNFTFQTGISMTSVEFAASAWGDYDNDGDLDILLMGQYYNYATYTPTQISKIYKNNGDNSFTEQSDISLTGVEQGAVAWGDYNNDGYLDILLAGYSENGAISKVYRNNGDNTFTEQTGISLVGIYDGSAAWGDYDNDGYLDILVAGNDTSKIYHNNGDGSFSESLISLTGIHSGSAAWGDYNNDGYLDILITGNSGYSMISKIYRNSGVKTFTEQPSVGLTGVYYSSVAWGDYNSDGYLDLIITGNPQYGIITTKIYKNNGDNTFTEQTGISLPGVESGSVAWGDYDNDGDLDILLAGIADKGSITKVYLNNGDNTFADQTDIILPALSHKVITWGDYDNDGDQDILLGDKIYRNYVTSSEPQKPNKKPLSPRGLKSDKGDNEYLLSWSGDNTDETPENSMSYNVAIAKTKISLLIGSPQNDETNRKVSALGNTDLNNFYKAKLIKGMYYWRVQAVDGGFKGGEWSVIDSIGSESYGIDTENITDQSEIFPNPVHTSLAIKVKDITDTPELYIYSIEGNLLYNTTLKDERTVIDMSSYRKGVYIIEISSSKKVIKKKIIKM